MPMTSPVSAPRNLPALTGVRFVAAFAVLALHMDKTGLFIGGAIGQTLAYGNLGVPFFFVLSGFILAHTYLAPGSGSRLDDRKGFYLARFARVYPVYLLSVLVATPHFLQHYRETSPWGAGKSLLFGFPFMATMTQNYIPTDFGVHGLGWWNGPAWSLGSEAFFYALFPLIAGFFYRPTWRQSLAFFVGLCLLHSLAMYGVDVLGHLAGRAGLVPLSHDGALGFAYRFPPARLPILCGGVSLYSLYVHLRDEGKLERVGAMGPALIVMWVALVLCASMDFFGAFKLFYPMVCGLMGLTILSLALGTSRFARWMSRPAFHLLGEASYSLYLLHATVLAAFHLAYTKLPKIVPQPVWMVAGAAFSIALSIFVFKRFETPMRLRIRGRKKPLPTDLRSEVAPDGTA